MTEQEQIEEEFKKFTAGFDLFGNEWQDMGCDEIFKAGWLAAKRAQKPIELPSPEDMYDMGGSWLGRFFADGHIHNALLDAGIQYTVKGED